MTVCEAAEAGPGEEEGCAVGEVGGDGLAVAAPAGRAPAGVPDAPPQAPFSVQALLISVSDKGGTGGRAELGSAHGRWPALGPGVPAHTGRGPESALPKPQVSPRTAPSDWTPPSAAASLGPLAATGEHRRGFEDPTRRQSVCEAAGRVREGWERCEGSRRGRGGGRRRRRRGAS